MGPGWLSFLTQQSSKIHFVCRTQAFLLACCRSHLFILTDNFLTFFLMQFNELAILEYVLLDSWKKIIFSSSMNWLHFLFVKIQWKKKIPKPAFSQMLTYLSKGAEMRWPMSYPDICHCLFMQALSPIQLSPRVLTSTSVKWGESTCTSSVLFLVRGMIFGKQPHTREQEI